MSFTLTGTVVKSDAVTSFSEVPAQPGQGPIREVVISGTTAGFDTFEAILRVSKDTNPSAFDPLAEIALGAEVTLEVTT
jgi:hypothetical protein